MTVLCGNDDLRVVSFVFIATMYVWSVVHFHTDDGLGSGVRRSETVRQFGTPFEPPFFFPFSICLAPFRPSKRGVLKLFRDVNPADVRAVRQFEKNSACLKFPFLFSICLTRFHGSRGVGRRPFYRHAHRRPCVLAGQIGRGFTAEGAEAAEESRMFRRHEAVPATGFVVDNMDLRFLTPASLCSE